ncbi:hypothetical protein Tco_0466079 [Tanacetum coccineum]
MALILTNFNANHLEQTDIVYTQPEHGASSSSGPQMGPEERMDPQVTAWFDEDVWIDTKEPISLDKKVNKRTLSFGDRMGTSLT